MISISVGFVSTPASALMPSLIVSGLIDGKAEVGANLSAVLSDGSQISSYAWGSTPGGTEYGTGAMLNVPATAAGRMLYLSVQNLAGLFSVVVQVAATAIIDTVISPDIGALRVESLALPAAQAALTPVPDTDTIIVEIS